MKSAQYSIAGIKTHWEKLILKYAVAITCASLIFYSSLSHASGCLQSIHAAEWIWPSAQSALEKTVIREIYLLQLTYLPEKKSFYHLGTAPYPLRNKKITIVIRLKDLPPVHNLIISYSALKEKWERHHVEVSGMQLDFDSPTRSLNNYADYLLEVRKELNMKSELSITGLGDWINNSMSFQEKLENSHISIFYQMYQGEKGFKFTDTQLRTLENYKINFRMGFLAQQDIDLSSLDILQKNIHYKGHLCFLTKPI
jgi:hypothetical protein